MINGREYDIYPKVGTPMICPVCGKQFKASDDTRYIRAGGYTCSWKCFLAPKKENEGTATDLSSLIPKESPKVDEIQPQVAKKSTVNTKSTTKTASKTKRDEKPRKKDEVKTKSTPTPKVVELF